MATLLDGRTTAAAIKAEVAARVSALRERGVVPGLGTLLVGDDPASLAYVAGKHRDCAEVGIESIRVDLPATAGERDVREAMERLNADPAVTAYIVQLPLPHHLDGTELLAHIDPAKDADGLHPSNLGRLVLDVPGLDATPLPCTPAGILRMLDHYGIDVHGREVVVIGRGLNVGRPLALMLTRRGFEDVALTLAHTQTPGLAEKARRADILVAAVGVPHLVRPDWVKPGAVVVDVGITRVGVTESGRARLAGDVDPAVGEVASYLSPVPGGIGLMTRAMLLHNVVLAAERSVA